MNNKLLLLMAGVFIVLIANSISGYVQSTQKLVVINPTIYAGGSGAGVWYDAGTVIIPNSSFAEDVNISSGYLMVLENITTYSYFDGMLECGNIVGGSDGDYCIDTSGNGSGSDTNASTACAGSTTYLDGEGNCDDISSIYEAESHCDEHDGAYLSCSGEELDVDASGVCEYCGYDQESTEDYVGDMVTGNTETRISVTYEDGDGTLDFVVDDMNDDTPDNDGEVPDDITIDSTKLINTTLSVASLDHYVTNGTVDWRMWVNASGYFIIEEV